VRNFAKPRFVFTAILRTLLTLWCLLTVFGVTAQDAPRPFAAEVRYHFREKLRTTKSGEKPFSAPSHEREALPESQLKAGDSSTVRVIEGTVPHLPYRFSIKIVPTDAGQSETLEVNILDSSGKSLTGFPQSMPNNLTKSAESSRKQFEVPISKPIKAKIEKTLLAKDQLLTHVDVVVGVDDDFLALPKPR